jgi:hypothetical protein
MNKIIEQIVNEIKLQIFNEVDKSDKTIIAIYPGRFQPMGAHHKASYDWLAQKFGEKNTYIVTSDKTDPQRSPFNFKEKKSIINKHGIKNVVKVVNPYNPQELLKKFDPKKTVVIYMIGEKDAGRLRGYKRLMKYNKTTAVAYKDLENPYAYYIYAPHVSYKIPSFGEMSGTNIRKALSDRSAKLSDLKSRFKSIMGWFDADIFNMVVSKMNTNRGKMREESEALPIVKREFWDKVFEEVLKEDTLITEGGVAGHMTHPFEDMGLTFGDLKEMFKLGLSGEISISGNPTEKLDGQNLFVTFRNGKLYAARNKGDIKNGGMDYKSIKTKFAGRGDIEEAFTYAFEDLENAVKRLTEKQQGMVFKDGNAWMNLEIMYPKSANVINYDGAYLVFHGVSLYNKDGEKVKDYNDYAKVLAGMIKQVNQDTQKTFSIAKPKVLNIAKTKNYKERLKYFTSKITELQKQMNCKDSDTLGMWHQRWWEKYINENAERLGVTVEKSVMESLVKRWAFYDKSFSLNSKNIENPELLSWAKQIDSTTLKDQLKKNIKPFETLVLRFGAEVMKNVSEVMALNPEKTTEKIRNDVKIAIDKLSKSNDIKDLDVLKTQLSRIKAAGGMKSIAPLEGIVFNFKGKTYKLTGAFAPINQLLGYFKFG